MPENNVINNEMIETATTTVAEVAKKADRTGLIFMGLGFFGGIGLTFGAIKGAKVIKNKVSAKKALKNAPKKRREILEAAAEAE